MFQSGGMLRPLKHSSWNVAPDNIMVGLTFICLLSGLLLPLTPDTPLFYLLAAQFQFHRCPNRRLFNSAENLHM